MLWEAHITVADEDIDRWCDFCRELDALYLPDVKPLYIELTSGETPKQLMFAARWEAIGLGEPQMFNVLSREVEDSGFTVLRKKLECPLDKSYELDPTLPNNPYSECHMKLMLPVKESEPIITEACYLAEVHASRNLLAVREGLEKWYLTQRDYQSDPRHAAAEFNWALSRVSEVYPAVRMEMEYVVSDSNPELDKGWAG